MCSLNTLHPGEKGKIISISSNLSTKRRLQDLGFVENSTVECLYKSFSKDPTAYNIRGSVIALRNIDASKIKIKKTEVINENI